MSILINLVILLTGLSLAWFCFWKLVKDDYENEDIFSLGFIIILGGILGFILLRLTFSQESLPGLLAFGLIFGFWRARRLKMKIFEILEGLVPALFIFLLFFLILQTLSLANYLKISLELGLIILALAGFFLLHRSFRRFLWYPSGKVGFASLASLTAYFFSRAAIELLLPNMLFLFSRSISIRGGVAIGLISLILIYWQSGRNVKDDLTKAGLIFKRRK